MEFKLLKILLLIMVTVFSANHADAILLSEVIPHPYYDVQKTSEGQENYLKVLNSGIASLQARIDLIRSAQKSIEVEYFIYGLDDASKILSIELANAAKRGINVRILVDKSMMVFELDPYYAKAMKEVGITVRYYNTAPTYRVSTINFRNHRKLLVVDDKFALTGGRNIGDDYFDLSSKYNFLDRDVIIEGPIVSTIRESFDEFFNHKISKTPAYPKAPPAFINKKIRRTGTRIKLTKKVENTEKVKLFENKMRTARTFLQPNEKTQELLHKIEHISRPILDAQASHLCPEITFSTDRPGGNFKTRLFDNYSDNYRYLRKTLFDKLSQVNDKLMLSSPYILNNEESREIMQLLLDRKVDITLYTNSLASTDAVYVAANLYRDVFKWARMGMRTFIHTGEFVSEAETINDEVKSARWGTHSKTHIYESIDEAGNQISEIMIGTYNIDNRSNYYNTEMAVFCKGNPELTNEVKKSAFNRIDEAFEIHPNKTATNKSGEKVSTYGVNPTNVRLMKLIALPSYLFKFLL